MVLLSKRFAILFAWLPSAYCFIVSSHVPSRSATQVGAHPQDSLFDDSTLQLLVSDAALKGSSYTTFMTANALDIVKNIVIGVVGIGVFLVGLAFLFSNWLIPQAAKQLEEQAKSVDPALWREYEAKMEPGESLEMRPDLIQELGTKVRMKMTEQFDAALERQKQQETQKESGDDSSADSSSSSNDGIMDATILSKEETKRD